MPTQIFFIVFAFGGNVTILARRQLLESCGTSYSLCTIVKENIRFHHDRLAIRKRRLAQGTQRSRHRSGQFLIIVSSFRPSPCPYRSLGDGTQTAYIDAHSRYGPLGRHLLGLCFFDNSETACPTLRSTPGFLRLPSCCEWWYL